MVGARATGMQAIWVDRVGAGWKDAVAPDLQPTAILFKPLLVFGTSIRSSMVDALD
jgi:hypothetical protein